MTATIATARRLYESFAARDPAGILAVLGPGFVGEVSDGMPLGVGGRHDGPEAMLRDVWGTVFARYEMDVRAEEYLGCADGRVVVLGRYEGVAREGDEVVDAAFAHVLTVEREQITSLRQITDTARWGVSRRP